MPTPTRPNGYLLTDTNSLIYAYRAGGTKLLDAYRNFADLQGREFAITSTVAKEIKDGPLGQELGRYLADKDIRVLETPKLQQQLDAGQVVKKNAGEASMLEVAAEEHTKGRSTRIWSEDKFFENPQQMRGAQGAEPVKTSQLLDQMRESQFITDAEYRRTQARYQAAVPEFKPASASHSQRLATFDGPAPRVLDHLGVADASIAAKPGFQNFAKATGLASGRLDGLRRRHHRQSIQRPDRPGQPIRRRGPAARIRRPHRRRPGCGLCRRRGLRRNHRLLEWPRRVGHRRGRRHHRRLWWRSHWPRVHQVPNESPGGRRRQHLRAYPRSLGTVQLGSQEPARCPGPDRHPRIQAHQRHHRPRAGSAPTSRSAEHHPARPPGAKERLPPDQRRLDDRGRRPGALRHCHPRGRLWRRPDAPRTRQPRPEQAARSDFGGAPRRQRALFGKPRQGLHDRLRRQRLCAE